MNRGKALENILEFLQRVEEDEDERDRVLEEMDITYSTWDESVLSLSKINSWCGE